MTLLSTSGNSKYFRIRPFRVTALLWSLNVPSAMTGLHQPTSQTRFGLGPTLPLLPSIHVHKPSIPTWCPCRPLKDTSLSVRKVFFFWSGPFSSVPGPTPTYPATPQPPVWITRPKTSFVPKMFFSSGHADCLTVQVSLKTLKSFHRWRAQRMQKTPLR